MKVSSHTTHTYLVSRRQIVRHHQVSWIRQNHGRLRLTIRLQYGHVNENPFWVWASELAIIEMQPRHKECPQCNTWALFWSEKVSEQIFQVINGVITISLKGCPTRSRIQRISTHGVSATGSTLACRLLLMLNGMIALSRFGWGLHLLHSTCEEGKNLGRERARGGGGDGEGDMTMWYLG